MSFVAIQKFSELIKDFGVLVWYWKKTDLILPSFFPICLKCLVIDVPDGKPH